MVLKLSYEENLVVFIKLTLIKQLITRWAAKGKVEIEEAQGNQVEAQTDSTGESLAKAQEEEGLAEQRMIRVSSRRTKMLALMADFV